MSSPGHRSRGYSLVELLIVLVIAGILAMLGVYSLRPKTTDAVRSVMSEIEGVLLNAQNSAYLSTQDIYITAKGDWVTAPPGNLIIDGRPLNTAVVGLPPYLPTSPILTPGSATNRLGSPSECFQSLYTQNVRDHLSAGVDDTGAWYTTALGGAAPLSALPFFANNATFSTGMTTNFAAAMNNPLCNNGGVQTPVVFSGISRQFLSGFSIVVVGLNGGTAVANGPIGVIVVPAGGANIYKYFKPNGSNTWGRM
jgi:prepilin-type N-terminal cleavage/methylation domain-containing protein